MSRRWFLLHKGIKGEKEGLQTHHQHWCKSIHHLIKFYSTFAKSLDVSSPKFYRTLPKPVLSKDNLSVLSANHSETRIANPVFLTSLLDFSERLF